MSFGLRTQLECTCWLKFVFGIEIVKCAAGFMAQRMLELRGCGLPALNFFPFPILDLRSRKQTSESSELKSMLLMPKVTCEIYIMVLLF